MDFPDKSPQSHELATVLRAQQGDREAFASLVEMYDRRLLYFVRRILGDTEGALDVLQSVWLAVHRTLGRLDAPEAFRVWLYRIAHHQAVSELRRRTRQPVLVDDVDATSIVDDPNLDESSFDNIELVHTAIQRLTVDHRRVITLRFLEEMTVEEIAVVIGCHPGTIKSRLHYAKAALRRCIKELTNG